MQDNPAPEVSKEKLIELVTSPAAPAAPAAPANTETLPLDKPAEISSVAELVTAPPTGPAGEVAATPEHVAEPTPLPGQPEETRRSLEDYRKLDWTKSNSTLSKECNVSRQRIQQVREQLRSTPAPAADFKDVIQLQTQQQQATNYQLMAESLFDMSTGTLTLLFGEEWQPKKLLINGQTIDERTMVVVPLKNYLEATGAKDLPPGVILACACISYSAPRVIQPNTKGKLLKVGMWLKLKFGGLFKRKSFTPKIVPAQPVQP